jgi:uncharacterized membrane protein YiaA
MGVNISPGQIWGELVTGLVLFSIGAWLAWFLPGYVRRKVRQNRMSEEEADNTLNRMSSKQGYIIMLLAVAITFAQLWRSGLFGYSKLLAVIPATVSLGLFVLWLSYRKNN